MATPGGSATAVGYISIEREDDAGVLRLVGEIDDSTIAAFEQDSATPGTSTAATSTINVVDLADVTYFSSAGVSFLLRQTRAERAQGRPPTLRGLVNPARRILQLTGVAVLFAAEA